MKKLLLGSTALVVGGLMAAPAMAADPIKMGVGGYYTFYGAAGNIDPTYAMNGSVTTSGRAEPVSVLPIATPILRVPKSNASTVPAGGEMWGLVLPEHFNEINRQRLASPELN